MTPIYIHAGLVCVGLLFIASGYVVARFLKKRSWWLKVHRLCGILGASLVLAGLFAEVLDISLGGRRHFRIPHSYIGTIAGILVVATPVLGFMQFRVKQHLPVIRKLHVRVGRIVLLLLCINILVGLSLMGIL
jgi:hypothetical protein